MTSYADVLDFWFGGDQAINYKTKWFPSGSTDLQQVADGMISEKFGDVFKLAVNGSLQHWCNEKRGTVALIIVLDQFSRHLFRKMQLPADANERQVVDSIALSLSEELCLLPSWDTGLSIPETVFSLMPLRHSPTIERLETVLSHIDRREKLQLLDTELLQKFRKQTTRRLQHLQDRKKVKLTSIYCYMVVTFVCFGRLKVLLSAVVVMMRWTVHLKGYWNACHSVLMKAIFSPIV